MRISVIFGSQSDKNIYEPLCDELNSLPGIKLFFAVCSAHREPEHLRSIIQEKECDIYIAGAGLAAHLPGVIASQTAKPVIGIPVDGVLHGLDALLSILQMPKGIPVLTTGINKSKSAIDFIKWYQLHREKPPTLNLLSTRSTEYLCPQMKEPLTKINWCFTEQNDHGAESSLDLWLADLLGLPNLEAGDPTVGIGVPVLSGSFPGNLNSLAGLTSRGGLWVGVNNLVNAQMALLELWPIGDQERMLFDGLRRGGKAGAAI